MLMYVKRVYGLSVHVIFRLFKIAIAQNQISSVVGHNFVNNDLSNTFSDNAFGKYIVPPAPVGKLR